MAFWKLSSLGIGFCLIFPGCGAVKQYLLFCNHMNTGQEIQQKLPYSATAKATCLWTPAQDNLQSTRAYSSYLQKMPHCSHQTWGKGWPEHHRTSFYIGHLLRNLFWGMDCNVSLPCFSSWTTKLCNPLVLFLPTAALWEIISWAFIAFPATTTVHCETTQWKCVCVSKGVNCHKEKYELVLCITNQTKPTPCLLCALSFLSVYQPTTFGEMKYRVYLSIYFQPMKI